MSAVKLNVLIAEDNLADAKIMQRAFGMAKLPGTMFFVRDGEQAIDFLLHRRAFADPQSAPRPDMVLLDIKMPKANGVEVLRLIKRESSLRRIPVTMLTSSADSEDINECYDLGANSYMVKPLDFDGFSHSVQAFCDYWTSVATLPNGYGFGRE